MKTSISNNYVSMTDHINHKSARNIFNAFDYMESANQTFNVYATINLKDKTDLSYSSQFGKLRQQYFNWSSYRKKSDDFLPLEFSFVFTLENPTGNNPHVNWVLRIPENYITEFENKLVCWYNKTGCIADDSTICMQTIEPESHKNVANYILKGIHSDYVDDFYLSELYSQKGDQGTVYGRRTGISRKIGPTALKNATFNATAYRQKRKY